MYAVNIWNGSWTFGLIPGWFKGYLTKNPELLLFVYDLTQPVLGEMNSPGFQ
jgi:hypothetical protein